jgi:bacterioferritin
MITKRRFVAMGTAGNALIKGMDVQELMDTLDGYYCYYVRALHWTHAVLNRLEGQAALVLTDELEEVAEQCLKNATAIAERIGELGGAVTGDPTHVVARSPAGAFSLPSSNSDVGAILGYALEQTRAIIGAYGECLDRTRGKDELTHRLVLKLLQQEVTHETDLEAALDRTKSLCPTTCNGVIDIFTLRENLI